MTGGACSTEGLTAGVAALPAARAQKAVHLDFDLGNMLALGVVEYTRVRTIEADAQDSGRHGNYTVGETAIKVFAFSVKGLIKGLPTSTPTQP